MTRKAATLPPDYFEDKYKADIDPWRFRSSAYEQEKYQATLSSLSRRRYANALEVGCSIGVLTRLLSARCAHLLAIDTSVTALEAARSVNDSNVSFRRATLPADFPDGPFDLIVLSEVLYYFAKPDLQLIAQSCRAQIAPDGEIVLCHWLGETDYPLTGIDASELFAEFIKPALPVRAILHDETYRLERFSAA
ncbi:class I SAM-dependent methyltransferase [Bradyrhizobium oligotrophicum]|uniref:class I SAM-dependent methyltransferase n=1 Tax=Bradyrhizobium oligotrophicum TaxID=44255 RepID=UPI003EB7737F